MLTMEAVHDLARKHNFKIFDTKDLDLTVIMLRHKPGVPNIFDDMLTVSWKEKGVWHFKAWPATSDPGTYWLQNPMNVKGTAIVVSNRQYSQSHVIGQHHAGTPEAYEAMVQCGALSTYRDANKDAVEDFVNETTTTGGGINIHHAGDDSKTVDKWSAACQVFKRKADFYEFMVLVHRQKDAGNGDKVSLGMLDWEAEF